jgi:hypothetical protein
VKPKSSSIHLADDDDRRKAVEEERRREENRTKARTDKVIIAHLLFSSSDTSVFTIISLLKLC